MEKAALINSARSKKQPIYPGLVVCQMIEEKFPATMWDYWPEIDRFVKINRKLGTRECTMGSSIRILIGNYGGIIETGFRKYRCVKVKMEKPLLCFVYG